MSDVTILVYVYSIYDNILGFFNTTAVLSFVVSGLVVAYSIENSRKALLKYLWLVVPCFILTMTVSILLPDKEYLPVILGAEPITTQVMESIQDGKLDKINTIVDNILEKQLQELSKGQ